METMRDTSCDEPPKKEQRRQRSNTIQWAIGDTNDNNSKQQESFEPVNFGDYRDKSPRKDSSGAGQVVRVMIPTATAGGPAFPLGFAASSDAATTSTTCTTTVANKQASSSAVPIVDKRQKRLERNRESARASRRRRKQYLEELESNVHNLSTDMDSGRMLHALEGVKVVAGMRKVVNTFFQQQLKSLILTHKQPITSATPNPAAAALSTSGSPILGPLLPSLTPFLLWLTLQNDDFFRGGRAQSERLSAARIGERLLHGGLYRVTPSTTGNKSAQHNDNKGGGGGRVLWPLLCHEIGLSYDQEDKIRTAQRLVLQNERHVAANMYIIDHKLGKVKQRVPPVAGKYVNPSQLKKLGRRPCFESLGGYDKDNTMSNFHQEMSRNDSAGSLLKRSLDDMSLGGTSSGLDTNVTAVTPEAAQAAGHAAASVFLKDVLPIILRLHSPQQQHFNAASSTFDDIPMPTPVSVLLQTPDDFLNPSDGGVNDNDMMGGVDPTAAIDPIPFVPEPVASSSISMMSRHQSAPEFGQYLGSPTAPIGMVPVPEGEDEDDFGILDDLPMDADDWLIGDDTLEF
ncbi:hypothetical protein QTG54_002239 [Skeletonema marinoi]|uniref:BZIP domain-containing protein n=1 Tax=Skeletonema marinoi TaxID=267567 RepID=A0AAD9DIE6_9STRA|nr:hypothetical protein QTG54_002239 [Skeletonema marinoi]